MSAFGSDEESAHDDPFAVLDTERAHPGTPDLETLRGGELAAAILAADTVVPGAVAAASDAIGGMIEAAADALRGGARLVYAGAGTSGRLALLDAVELGPTFGLDAARVPVLMAGGTDAVFRAREGAEDQAMDGARAVAAIDLTPFDFLVGVTASGRTPFTLGALKAARRRGARTGGIVCNRVEDDFPAEFVATLSTGPEVLAGSTRMKAGTATKMALNALSLGAMARIGKVHRNRMVDVRVGSEKLRARARRLVVQLGAVDGARADELLASADGHVKVAVLMAHVGCSVSEARDRLNEADDSLTIALASGSDA